MTLPLHDPGLGLRVSPLCLGTMYFGTAIDEATSFAILDRYVAAGGNFIDTANCYCFWQGDGKGGESEALIGRWLRSRGMRHDVVLASKVGAAPHDPAKPYSAHNREGLSPAVIRQQAHDSLRRLGVDRLDLFYAHADDRRTPLADTLRAFGRLVQEGDVGTIGASNHTAWRLAQAREQARQHELPLYRAVQQRHSYLQARPPHTPLTDEIQLPVTTDLLDLAAAEGDLAVLGYSVLLSGAYSRSDRAVPPAYDTPGVPRRLAALKRVAAEAGATPNQVVLAWMMGGDRPVLPVIGVSTVAQLEECLAAASLQLDPAWRAQLDEA